MKHTAGIGEIVRWVRKALAFHVADPGTISSTSYGPLGLTSVHLENRQEEA